MCDVSYTLQAALIEHRAAVLAAALAPHQDGAHTIPDDIRAEFDASLVAGPEPETTAVKLARSLGVA